MRRHRGFRGANNNKEQESKGPINTTIRIALEAKTTLSQRFSQLLLESRSVITVNLESQKSVSIQFIVNSLCNSEMINQEGDD